MAEADSVKEQSDAYELKRSVKNSMGLVVFAVVMTVVSIAAGVYIVIDKMTDQKRIDDAVSKNCLTPADPSLAVPTIDDIDDDGGSSASIATDTITPNASDYIYVEEWGVRIKKPADYYVWYHYEPDTGSSTKGKLVLSASPTDAQAWLNYGDFDGGRGLLYIYRRDASVTAWEDPGSAPKFIGSYNGYSYFYSDPQACSSHLVEYGSDACQREESVYNALRDTMTNLDNWSTF